MDDLKAIVKAARREWSVREYESKQTVVARDLFDKLDSMLTNAEPRLARKFLKALRDEGFHPTNRQLSDMLRLGEVPPEMQDKFKRAYASLVQDVLQEEWGFAFTAGSRSIFATLSQLDDVARLGDLQIPLQIKLDQWVEDRAGMLITSLSDNQVRAVNGILRQGIVVEALSPTQLGSLIERVVGLDAVQARALSRIRAQAEADGNTPAQVDRIIARNQDRMLRARGKRIARTELVSAFNQGTRDTVEAAFEGEPERLNRVAVVWQTSLDERVCPICSPLNGAVVGFQASFNDVSRGGLIKTPPAHAMCRCVLLYRLPER